MELPIYMCQLNADCKILMVSSGVQPYFSLILHSHQTSTNLLPGGTNHILVLILVLLLGRSLARDIFVAQETQNVCQLSIIWLRSIFLENTWEIYGVSWKGSEARIRTVNSWPTYAFQRALMRKMLMPHCTMKPSIEGFLIFSLSLNFLKKCTCYFSDGSIKAEKK